MSVAVGYKAVVTTRRVIPSSARLQSYLAPVVGQPWRWWLCAVWSAKGIKCPHSYRFKRMRVGNWIRTEVHFSALRCNV